MGDLVYGIPIINNSLRPYSVAIVDENSYDSATFKGLRPCSGLYSGLCLEACLGTCLGACLGSLFGGAAWGHARGYRWGVFGGVYRRMLRGAILEAIPGAISGAIPEAHCKILNLLSNYYSFIGIYHLRNPGRTSGALGIRVILTFSRGMEVKIPSKKILYAVRPA